MSDKQDDKDARVYDVIELLANREQIGQGIAKVFGPIVGVTEASCRVGSWSQGVDFDAGDLPEGDRIKILECGVSGKPGTNAVVTIDFKTGRAINIDFREDASRPS